MKGPVVKVLRGKVRKQSSNKVCILQGAREKRTSRVFRLPSEQEGLWQSLFQLWKPLQFCRGMQKAVKQDSTTFARKKAVINLPVSKKATTALN